MDMEGCMPELTTPRAITRPGMPHRKWISGPEGSQQRPTRIAPTDDPQGIDPVGAADQARLGGGRRGTERSLVGAGSSRIVRRTPSGAGGRTASSEAMATSIFVTLKARDGFFSAARPAATTLHTSQGCCPSRVVRSASLQVVDCERATSMEAQPTDCRANQCTPRKRTSRVAAIDDVNRFSNAITPPPSGRVNPRLGSRAFEGRAPRVRDRPPPGQNERRDLVSYE